METAERVSRVCVPQLDDILGVPFKVLDDGFVRVVDYMGGDESIVQAARVSYGKGTKKVSEDKGLIRYLLRHRHCYDQDTEVLTGDGFKKWPDVNEEDLVGIWDPEKSSLCYEKPEYLTRDSYEGDMYSVEHGGVSLMVTPEHSMYVKTKIWRNKRMQWANSYSLMKASDLDNRSMVRYCKLAPLNCISDFDPSNLFPSCNSPRDLLRLIGFFIGDGAVDHTSVNSFGFHLQKQRKKDFLKYILPKIGWELRELGCSATGQRFSVCAPNVGKIFRQFYDQCGEKTIPDIFCRLNKLDSLALLDGLRNSDGTRKRGAWEYSTSVYGVAEKVQIIALHAGEAAHIQIPQKNVWRVSIMSRMREPVINQGQVNTHLRKYKGIVYCAKTRTGILVVRRNGKIVLSGNTTPFEMCEIKFHVRVPMDCWRQWVRHRTASINETSTRYSEAIDAAQRTAPDKWRMQAKDNRQGSSGYLAGEGESAPGKILSLEESKLQDECRRVYESRLKQGVAREQARKDLPLATYTEAYWKCDLHNLLHFLALRMDAHAQEEIRSYATIMGEEIISKWVPIAWEAFKDYRIGGISFSRMESSLLKLIATGWVDAACKQAEEFGWLEKNDKGGFKRNRERDDFEAKLKGYGIEVPWEAD